jgi:DNA primase
LAQQITQIEALKTWPIPNIDILISLLEILQKQPHLTTGALLEHWRDHPLATKLARLASYDHPSPQEGVAFEFMGALKRLEISAQQHNIEVLLEKAKQQTLTLTEKQYLQQLLRLSKV